MFTRCTKWPLAKKWDSAFTVCMSSPVQALGKYANPVEELSFIIVKSHKSLEIKVLPPEFIFFICLEREKLRRKVFETDQNKEA